MKKLLLALLISGLIAGLFSFSALADLILTPTDDTYTDLNDQTTNFDDQALIAEYSSGPCTVSRRVYFRYNVSSLPIDVGPQTKVRAYISIPAGISGTLALWSTSDDWNGGNAGNGDETSLTWANAPALIQQLDTKPSGTASNWLEFSGSTLSTFINSQRSANGGDNTVSFAVQWADCVDPVLDLVVFEDKENTLSTGNTPQLYPLSPTAITLSSFGVESNTKPYWLFGTVLVIIVLTLGLLISARSRSKTL
jgi:hypothetical protein